MVPQELKDRVWAEYRPGQERTKTPSRSYLGAAIAAINAVAKNDSQVENCPNCGEPVKTTIEHIYPDNWTYNCTSQNIDSQVEKR